MASGQMPVALKPKPNALLIMEAAAAADPAYRPGHYGHPNASALMGASAQTSKVLNGHQLPGIKSALRTAWLHGQRIGADPFTAMGELFDLIDADGNVIELPAAPMRQAVAA